MFNSRSLISKLRDEWKSAESYWGVRKQRFYDGNFIGNGNNGDGQAASLSTSQDVLLSVVIVNFMCCDKGPELGTGHK